MKISFVVFLLLLTFIGCSYNNQRVDVSYNVYSADSIQHFNLNTYLSNQEYDVSEILDSVKIVCLETNEESLLSGMTGIVITDDRIFVSDLFQMGGVAIFDKNGNFIDRLNRGNGPGEIQNMLDIQYDKYSQELVVIDNHQLKKYDKDGNYKESVDVGYPCCRLLSCFKEGYLFSNVFGCESDIPTLANYSVIVADRNCTPKQFLLPYNNSNKIVNSPNKAFKYGDDIVISEPYSDTIYKFSNDSLFPYKTIDYSSKKLDVSQFTSLQEYTEKIIFLNDATKAEFKGDYYENTTHQIIALHYSSTPNSIFIDKNTNNVISGYICSYDPSEAFNISAPVGVYNDWFFKVCEPSNFEHNVITSNKYISKEDLAKLESLNDDDNFYIMFYKLKHF